MSVEQRQVKKTRNRILDYVKQATPEKLIRLALYLKIKIPDELVEKYTKGVD